MLKNFIFTKVQTRVQSLLKNISWDQSHYLGTSLDSEPGNDIELSAAHVLSPLAESKLVASSLKPGLNARLTWMRCTPTFRKLSFFEASFGFLLGAFLLYVLGGC